jgi:formylglycine-generating enzyme required for sulfatase activity
MGVYEVTNAQYDQFVKDSGYSGAADTAGSYMRHHKDWNEYASPGGEYPVVCVSWNNTHKFCQWLSRKSGPTVRLATEAEWEYACRAGTTSRFGFGDSDRDLGSHAWYADNSGSKTHPVGGKRANAWGLYDMHGNVWEWCQDWYGKDSYSKRRKEAPAGPRSYRVARGGCSPASASRCRSADRGSFGPSHTNPSLGFV